jgi:hypothetical protein
MAAGAAAAAEKGMELRGHWWILTETEYVEYSETTEKNAREFVGCGGTVEGEGIELGELLCKQHAMLHKLDCIWCRW